MVARMGGSFRETSVDEAFLPLAWTAVLSAVVDEVVHPLAEHLFRRIAGEFSEGGVGEGATTCLVHPVDALAAGFEQACSQFFVRRNASAACLASVMSVKVATTPSIRLSSVR